MFSEGIGCVFSPDKAFHYENRTNLSGKVNMTQAAIKAKLEISPTVEKTEDGLKVMVSTVLSNTGSSPLWVNKRLLFNTVYAPKPRREIWFDVKTPSGKVLEFDCKIKADKPREEDYTLLPPGEAVKAEIKLSKCFDMQEKGNYQVKAHYQDGNKEVPPAPENAAHLKEELESETIKITIE